MVSRVLVSTTFLEAPERFQPCQPLEPLDWCLGRAGAKEPRDKRGGTPPDGILCSLLGLSSDSLDRRAPTGLIGEMEQLIKNGHKIR